MTNKIKLGSEVVVSDPCYTIPTWCQAVVDKVKPGMYDTHLKKHDAGDWGERCSMLLVIHEDHKDDILRWEDYPATIGVDSGQCGIFSKETYRNDSITEKIGLGDGDISFFGVSPWKEMTDGRKEEEGEIWYVSMCSRTLGEKSWGVYDSGVVSSSGFGDGSYTLYVAKKRGKIVAMCVDFQVEEEGIIDFDFFRDIQLEK